jgi:hypothetical protein
MTDQAFIVFSLCLTPSRRTTDQLRTAIPGRSKHTSAVRANGTVVSMVVRTAAKIIKISLMTASKFVWDQRKDYLEAWFARQAR